MTDAPLSSETSITPKPCDACGRLGYTDYENELNQEAARKGIRNGELERQRALLMRVLRQSYTVMGAAFNRLDRSPSISDDALASRLEAARVQVEQAFTEIQESL